MAYDFNVNEIFAMAIQNEEKAGRFYRKAASQQSDEQKREMLEKLAAMEDHHKLIFEKMRNSLSDAEKTETVFDPDNESAVYLAAMADEHGGEGSKDAADALKGDESIDEIIDIAIGMEKESIVFYIGMKDFVPPKYGQDKLDTIINEERRHIIQLNGYRKRA